MQKGAKIMNREQERQIVDYYSATDKYIKSALHSQAHQSVFTKDNDKYQRLVLEQKSQNQVEVRQTDNYATITARDNYELTGNIPKCVGVECLCKDINMQIPFNADEINLIDQFGKESKAETCANLCAILLQVKDNDTKRIINATLKKLNALSEETCEELTAATKRRKPIQHDHSIKTRLARAKEQSKQLTVSVGKRADPTLREIWNCKKLYFKYHKPRAVSTEPGESARHRMIERNREKGDKKLVELRICLW